MSDLSSDSETNNVSIEVDITCSSKSTDSYESTDYTTNSTGQARWTQDNLSGILEIPTWTGGPALTGYAREGVQWLRHILEFGPTAFPYRSFINKLSDM